jgi:hypothetical protein|nr:MAG TPA: hypothetical protein [Caudoviricetes sp.]
MKAKSDTCKFNTRTGTTLIPDKLKPVVSDAIYPLLQDVLSRYRHSEAGTSVFDVMTEEEYQLYKRLIDDAINTVRSNR